MKHIFWFQHRYLPVGVEPGTGDVRSTLTLEKIAKNVPLTLVLFKCKCGNIKTKLIEGSWTLDQIKEKTLNIIKSKL